MQVQKSSRKIGLWSVAVAIVAGLAVLSVSPSSAQDTPAEEGTKAAKATTLIEKKSIDWAAAGNRVFFRGGYARLSSDRGGELFTDVHNTAGLNDSQGGYYVGGGADLMMTKDLWGMLDGVGVAGEIGVEYKRYDSNVVTSADALSGVLTPTLTQLTMLTISIAPKVKFLQGTDFQPWIIPAGLDFLVISPPSNQGQYVDVGVQFGGGLEYRVWKAIWVGLDTRYHLTAGATNTVNNYLSAGAYVGIGF